MSGSVEKTVLILETQEAKARRVVQSISSLLQISQLSVANFIYASDIIYT